MGPPNVPGDDIAAPVRNARRRATRVSIKAHTFRARLRLLDVAFLLTGLHLPGPIAILIVRFGGTTVDASHAFETPAPSIRGAKRRQKYNGRHGHGCPVRLKRAYPFITT